MVSEAVLAICEVSLPAQWIHTGHEWSRYRLAIVLLLLRPHLSFLAPSSFAAGRAPLKAAPRPKPYLGNPTARL
uniref:Uncharacterized protein n=1 Tax=Oryza meridionalis TaxID=40149 RepID=A0A0E0CA09_9ORYZ